MELCVCGGGKPCVLSSSGWDECAVLICHPQLVQYFLSEPLVISPLHCSAAYEKGNFLPCYLKGAVCDLLLAGPDLQNLLSEEKSDMSAP